LKNKNLQNHLCDFEPGDRGSNLWSVECDGRPSGPAEDVITGFLVDGDKARGRPPGLAVDGQGALLIADDTGNSVWRVSAAFGT
jgi:glucose/arabinose dehydrogenase